MSPGRVDVTILHLVINLSLHFGLSHSFKDSQLLLLYLPEMSEQLLNLSPPVVFVRYILSHPGKLSGLTYRELGTNYLCCSTLFVLFRLLSLSQSVKQSSLTTLAMVSRGTFIVQTVTLELFLLDVELESSYESL